METIKRMLDKYGRKLLAKWLTRLLIYGAVAISAKVAVTAPSEDTLGKVAEWAAVVLCGLAAWGIDSLHQKKDRSGE